MVIAIGWKIEKRFFRIINFFSKVRKYNCEKLGKIILLFTEAAATNRSVHFNYRKYEGERSERTIYPESFKKIGTSLCVRGYCTLRNEDRTFAIKRITKLQMVD